MTSPTSDRRQGLNSSAAIKVPCRAASTGNLALSGLQTVDGVALATGDRVLVKNQTAAADNGIYVADTGNWTRDLDFQGAYDVIEGTLCSILSGSTQANTFWKVSTTGAITIGSTALTFIPSVAAYSGSSSAVSFIQNITGAIYRSVLDKLRDIINIQDLNSLMSTALTGIGATPATLKITTAVTLGAAAVVPSTLKLSIEKGGSIALNGFNLTINGPFEAGLHKVFDTSGGGVVTFGSQMSNAHAVWWQEPDGATDNAAAIQACLDSKVSNLNAHLDGLSGWVITSGIVVKGGNKRLRGGWANITAKTGNNIVCIKVTTVTDGAYEYGNGADEIYLSGAGLAGTANTGYQVIGKADRSKNRDILISAIPGLGYHVQGGVKVTGGVTANNSPEKGYHRDIIVDNCTNGVKVTSVPAGTLPYDALVTYTRGQYCTSGTFSYECIVASTLGNAPTGTAAANAQWTPALSGVMSDHDFDNIYVPTVAAGGIAYDINTVAECFFKIGGESGGAGSFGLHLNENGTSGGNWFGGGFIEGYDSNVGNFKYLNPNPANSSVVAMKGSRGPTADYAQMPDVTMEFGAGLLMKKDGIPMLPMGNGDVIDIGSQDGLLTVLVTFANTQVTCYALFYLALAADGTTHSTELIQHGATNLFSVTAATANSINVYWNAGTSSYRVQLVAGANMQAGARVGLRYTTTR